MNNEKTLYEMNIRVNHDNHIAAWIRTDKLVQLLEQDWRHNMDGWSTNPKPNYFAIVGTDDLAFYMPCVQLVNDPDGYRVHFLHKPDRVEWLLSFNPLEIPVAIYHDFDIEQSGTNLGIRPMLNGETLPLPGDFNPGPIIDAIRAQEDALKNVEFPFVTRRVEHVPA